MLYNNLYSILLEIINFFIDSIIYFLFNNASDDNIKYILLLS